MSGTDRDRERIALRRLFGAAAADETPASAPAFLAARARARAAERADVARSHPIGVAAWRLLPVFGAIALAVASFSGFETWAFARDREAAMARMLAPEGRGDMLVAVLLFASQAGDTTGGAP